MGEHTYTAQRLDTALARVRRELGADAAILSSRRLDQGGFEIRARPAEDGTPIDTLRPSASLLERLLAQTGLDTGIAKLLGASARRDARTLGEAQNALREALEAQIDFDTPELDHGRKIIALVGPTGVGKTTTLAKLAAEVALVRHRAVGIITLDGYRIGAVAQIQQYADLIGVPLQVARDAGSFARSVRRLADAEVIFVDTAGRSRSARSAQAQLAETLHSSGVEVNVTLCIAAATRTDELDQAIDRHTVLRPTHVAITKVDEALRHDATVAAPMSSGLPLAWLATGQRVPEDMEVATAGGLAALLCGQEDGE